MIAARHQQRHFVNTLSTQRPRAPQPPGFAEARHAQRGHRHRHHPLRHRRVGPGAVAPRVGVKPVARQSCQPSKESRSCGPGSRSSAPRNSSGRLARACWTAAKKASQVAGLRDRMTSPVSTSCRMSTSLPSKRQTAGRCTAWLRPLMKSFAVWPTINLLKSAINARGWRPGHRPCVGWFQAGSGTVCRRMPAVTRMTGPARSTAHCLIVDQMVRCRLRLGPCAVAWPGP